MLDSPEAYAATQAAALASISAKADQAVVAQLLGGALPVQATPEDIWSLVNGKPSRVVINTYMKLLQVLVPALTASLHVLSFNV